MKLKYTTQYPESIKGHESILRPGYYRGRIRGHQDVLFGVTSAYGFSGQKKSFLLFFNEHEPAMQPVMAAGSPDNVDAHSVTIEEALLAIR